MLHTMNKSSFTHRVVDQWVLRINKAEDALVLIEDGVYNALKASPVSPVLGEMDLDEKNGKGVFVLGPDLRSRGLKEDSLSPGISVIEDEQFVELCVAHDSSISWF